MNLLRATTTRMLTIRAMEPSDLPRLLHIENQTPVPRWDQVDFKTDLRSSDRINLVATIRNYVVGYAIARLLSAPEAPLGEARVAARLGGRSPAPPPVVHLGLLHLAVAPDWLRRGIGLTLVKQLETFLRHPPDSVQAAVPETSLPAQLLLRSAGYQAVRVLRGHYGEEDAYLMERRRT